MKHSTIDGHVRAMVREELLRLALESSPLPALSVLDPVEAFLRAELRGQVGATALHRAYLAWITVHAPEAHRVSRTAFGMRVVRSRWVERIDTRAGRAYRPRSPEPPT